MDFDFLSLMLAGAGALVVFSAVRIVAQGHEFTLERFGRYTRTLKPGLHFVIPFVDRIGARLNIGEQLLELPGQAVITRDNVMLRVDGVVFFQVFDAARAAYQVNHLVPAILNLTMTHLPIVTASMDLDEVLAGRDQINRRLSQLVGAATGPWGVQITRIEIRDLSPPAEILQAMARRMVAVYESQAHILEAEGHRQAMILRAEGEKQAALVKCEGIREAAMPDEAEALTDDANNARPLPPGIKRRTGGWPEGSLSEID